MPEIRLAGNHKGLAQGANFAHHSQAPFLLASVILPSILKA